MILVYCSYFLHVLILLRNMNNWGWKKNPDYFWGPLTLKHSEDSWTGNLARLVHSLHCVHTGVLGENLGQVKDNLTLLTSHDLVYVVIFDWLIFMEPHDLWSRFTFDLDHKFGLTTFLRCEILNGDQKLWGSDSLDTEIWNIVKANFSLVNQNTETFYCFVLIQHCVISFLTFFRTSLKSTCSVVTISSVVSSSVTSCENFLFTENLTKLTLLSTMTLSSMLQTDHARNNFHAQKKPRDALNIFSFRFVQIIFSICIPKMLYTTCIIFFIYLQICF